MASQKAAPEFAAFVAIDWADKIRYWSLRAAGSNQIERGEVENTPEAVEVWAAQWSVRFNSRPIAVAGAEAGSAGGDAEQVSAVALVSGASLDAGEIPRGVVSVAEQE